MVGSEPGFATNATGTGDNNLSIFRNSLKC
jgi:hypothetical protein